MIEYSSGGPFLIYDSNSDTWNIAGITSYGEGCAKPRSPGVYTRVSMYIDWIQAHMNEDPSNSSWNLNPSIKLLFNITLLHVFCMNIFFKLNYQH